MDGILQNSTQSFPVYFGTSGLTVTVALKKEGGGFNSVAPGISDDGNGYYTITPIAAHRDTLGVNRWLMSASGQPSMPYVERVVAYNSATTWNSIAPDNAGIAAGAASAATAATQATNAAASAATAATQSTNGAASAASADSKLTAGRLSRVDRLPDIIAGASGGLALVGSEMALSNANLTALFADADVAGLIASVQALFDNAGDLPVQTIAAQSAAATVAAIIANGQILTLLADAAAAKVAAEAVNGRLPATPASQSDVTTAVAPLATTAQMNARTLLAAEYATAAVQTNHTTSLGTINTAAAAVKVVTDKVATMLEADGGSWRLTVGALFNAPAGGGGGGGDVDVAAIAAQTAQLVLAALNAADVPDLGTQYDPDTMALRLQAGDDYTAAILRTLPLNVTEHVERLPSEKRTGLQWQLAVSTGKVFTSPVALSGSDYVCNVAIARTELVGVPESARYTLTLVTTAGERVTVLRGAFRVERVPGQ